MGRALAVTSGTTSLDYGPARFGHDAALRSWMSTLRVDTANGRPLRARIPRASRARDTARSDSPEPARAVRAASAVCSVGSASNRPPGADRKP